MGLVFRLEVWLLREFAGFRGLGLRSVYSRVREVVFGFCWEGVEFGGGDVGRGRESSFCVRRWNITVEWECAWWESDAGRFWRCFWGGVVDGGRGVFVV